MKYLSILAFTIVFTHVYLPYAMADSYSRTPSGNGTYQTVELNVFIDSVDLLTQCPDGFWTAFAQSNFGNNILNTQLKSTSENPATFILEGNFLAVEQIVAGCEFSQANISSLEYDNQNILFTIDPNFVSPISTNTTWGNDNGFWGDSFSIPDIKNNMQASVQATGVSIWPLFALLGIPIAFILAYYLLDFIYYSVIMGQSSKLSSMSPKLDRAVYLPYKGYNRLRSREWNRSNTLK